MQNNEAKEGRRTRILVVDDDKDIAGYLGAVLTLEGYEAIETHRAEQAIQVIREDPPDLVLTDLMMPGLGGLGLLTYLKQDKSLPFIPVIMVTALHDNIDKAAALEAGCDDFLTKPVNKSELQARIRSLLRLKRINDSLNRKLAQRERDSAISEAREQAEQAFQTETQLTSTVRKGLEGLLNSALSRVQLGILHNGIPRQELVDLSEELKQALEVINKLM